MLAGEDNCSVMRAMDQAPKEWRAEIVDLAWNKEGESILPLSPDSQPILKALLNQDPKATATQLRTLGGWRAKFLLALVLANQLESADFDRAKRVKPEGYQEALRLLEEAAVMEPGNGIIPAMRAVVMEKLGQEPGKIKAFLTSEFSKMTRVENPMSRLFRDFTVIRLKDERYYSATISLYSGLPIPYDLDLRNMLRAFSAGSGPEPKADPVFARLVLRFGELWANGQRALMEASMPEGLVHIIDFYLGTAVARSAWDVAYPGQRQPDRITLESGKALYKGFQERSAWEASNTDPNAEPDENGCTPGAREALRKDFQMYQDRANEMRRRGL